MRPVSSQVFHHITDMAFPALRSYYDIQNTPTARHHRSDEKAAITQSSLAESIAKDGDPQN